MPKKTVAIVNPNYPPTICGVGDHTFYLVQALLQAGVETHIICSADQKPAPVEQPKIYPMIEKWDKKGFQQVINKLDEIQPDWVIVQYLPHAYDPRGLPFPILGFYKNLSKKHFSILTVFHEVRVRPGKKLSSRFISAVETFMARQITRASKKVTTSIDFYADLLRGRKKNLPIFIVPIGTGIAPVETSERIKNDLKKRYDIPLDAPVIVTFGNRDVSVYLDAFDQLAKDAPDFVWVLCGKTSTSEAVLKSRRYLRNTGKMSAHDIYQALCMGDAAFMPEPVNAKMEGGSSNKSTALACVFSLGIPIIGVKGDLNNALLEHDKNILLVDTNDSLDLYDALKYVLNTEGGHERLGRGAADLYETALSWDVVGRQYLALMDIETRQNHLTL